MGSLSLGKYPVLKVRVTKTAVILSDVWPFAGQTESNDLQLSFLWLQIHEYQVQHAANCVA
jgi:hypothetical protein